MNRNVYFDALRGIAIMMVIAIHTFEYRYGDFSLFVRQVFNIAVPLFLAISGFFLAKKNVDTREAYINFLKRQVPKVYIPVILWSLPLFVLDCYQSGQYTLGVITLILCGYSVYYFIALIVQYYVLLPHLQKCRGVLSGGGIFRSVNFIY